MHFICTIYLYNPASDVKLEWMKGREITFGNRYSLSTCARNDVQNHSPCVRANWRVARNKRGAGMGVVSFGSSWQWGQFGRGKSEDAHWIPVWKFYNGKTLHHQWAVKIVHRVYRIMWATISRYRYLCVVPLPYQYVMFSCYCQCRMNNDDTNGTNCRQPASWPWSRSVSTMLQWVQDFQIFTIFATSQKLHLV